MWACFETKSGSGAMRGEVSDQILDEVTRVIPPAILEEPRTVTFHAVNTTEPDLSRLISGTTMAQERRIVHLLARTPG